MTAPTFLDRLMPKVAPHFGLSLSIAKGVTELLKAQTEVMRRLDAIDERLDGLEQ